jgi:16S rRNA processing protein RimM
VLVVRGDNHSLDRQERLIPWVPDEFVTEVNLGEGYLVVDWDPAF